ncbi:phosphate-selective porin O/P [Algoriphagus ratkowskyi]|uniref:Porin n=1 Tax=Algoriphagus ratkowskyi TaxID=57028 RepID=A0A2W7RQV7_9BACT|nr:porin [Algoriphagus ratkowskyi]PZX57737.1 phosphate-selective porin O/P [Algoriphagus ratkowskyi]TXD79004.1 porin [Algoriphagus ratkowskyi]
MFQVYHRISSTIVLLCLVIFFRVESTIAQELDSTLTNPEKKETFLNHTSKGFILASEDGKYEMQIAARLQLRFAVPDDQDPITFSDFANQDQRIFKINRARLKVGGHAYQPWLKYYFEYELSRSLLLDYRVMIEKWPWLNFKAGQWKVEFTRERFISSGEQQMVDRSLLNRKFTVDRQQGVEVYGNLDGGGIANFNYWAAALTGMGRGATQNDDSKMMYFGRFQWNFLGREVPFSGGDLTISQKPAAIIAIAAISNTSPYTRFSTSGGGNLSGFEGTNDSQYTVNQYQLETAFIYKGFSWASEFHRKNILDNFDEEETLLGGFYITAGYLAHQTLNFWPEPLEIAVRYAEVRPDLSISNNIQRETAIAFNWFFADHKNKLTTELTRFKFQDQELAQDDEIRFRLQLDISF